MKRVELQQQLDKSILSAVTDVMLMDACGLWIDSTAPISTGSGESSPLLGEISFNCQKELGRRENACGDGISQEEIAHGFHIHPVTSCANKQYEDHIITTTKHLLLMNQRFPQKNEKTKKHKCDFDDTKDLIMMP